jgi:poly(3-hydroxybutyrate) depolymerase
VTAATSALALVVPAPASAAAVTVRRATSNLTVPCGSSGTTLSTDWYFPAVASPTGVVWVQHGFSSSKSSIAALANHIAANTRAIVVAPTISSNFLSLNGCWINGLAMHQAVARMFGDRFSALQSSATAAATLAGAGTIALPRRFVLTGHSAGGNLATSAAGYTTLISSGGSLVSSNLRGVVMYDGVDNGGAIGTGVDRLSGANYRRVWTIAAPDSSCNATGSGTRLLKSKRPSEFIGIRLMNGTHVDATGSANITCGTPRAENVAAVRTLAASWISNLLAGTPTSALLATTAAGTSSAVGSATAVTL